MSKLQHHQQQKKTNNHQTKPPCIHSTLLDTPLFNLEDSQITGIPNKPPVSGPLRSNLVRRPEENMTTTKLYTAFIYDPTEH